LFSDASQKRSDEERFFEASLTDLTPGLVMICPTCGHNNLPGSEQCRNCLQDLTSLDRPTGQDRVERSLLEDRVSVLRQRRAVTLPPSTTVDAAMKAMLVHNTGAVLIVDEAGRLLGIFSERDLLTRVAGPVVDALGDAGLTANVPAGPVSCARPVSEFMTPNPETVRSTDTLAFVLHKMDAGGYRHLPVQEPGQPLRMISVRDMLHHITRLCRGCCR
jgi:CBS domain-containing protein